MSATFTILIALTLISWMWGALDIAYYARDPRSKPFWLLVIFALPIIGSLIYFQSRFYKWPIEK